jgi:hypothetical protein
VLLASGVGHVDLAASVSVRPGFEFSPARTDEVESLAVVVGQPDGSEVEALSDVRRAEARS